MSSTLDKWKSPAWAFQDKADAAYDLLSGMTLGTGGALDLPSTLDVTGAVDFDSTLNVDGAATLKSTLEVDGATQLDGQVTLGDALADAIILKGRLATGSAAGAALDVGATYAYGEGIEIRHTVSDWTLGSSFKSLYLRAQSDADKDGGELMGAQVFAVANACDIDNLLGIQSYAYFKGDSAETSTRGFGIHAELSWDAGRANATTLTEAAPILGKVTAGKVADYTKIHGAIFRFGDMDGGNRVFGAGIKFDDDQDMGGTASLTNVIETNMAATNFLKIGATGQGGVTITDAWNTIQDPADLAGVLKILVNETAYYIDLYTSTPTTV